MKIAFVSTYYRAEEKTDLERFKKKIKLSGFKNYSVYSTDCINNNRGYAAGINIGISKALSDNADIIIVHNLDIDLNGITYQDIIKGSEKFDIFGFAFKQNGKVYYGGVIDKWRLSGGLSENKPESRYNQVDFVSGSMIIIKPAVFKKIGLLPEDYFIYYEEVDFCTKACINNFSIGIDSSKYYLHFEVSDSVNPDKQTLLAKNRLKYFMKYSSISQKMYELIRFPKTLINITGLLFNYVKQHKFIINFSSINISAMFNKLLNFLLFLLLIRSFSAENYGLYTLIWVQAGLLSPLLDLGTTSYGIIYLPTRKQQDFDDLFSLRLFLAVIVYILTLIISYLIGFNYNSMVLISLAGILIFFNAISGSYLILSSILQKIYINSAVSIIQNLFLVILSMMIIILNQNLLPLFIVAGSSYFVFCFINYFLIKQLQKNIKLVIRPYKWLQIIKKSSVFVIISLLGGLYFKADIYLLKILKGTTEIGIYSAGYKFFEALLIIVGSYNITRVPIMAKVAATSLNDLKRLIRKDIFYFGFLGLFIALLTFFLIPILLPLLVTGQYLTSIKILQIIVFALPLVLISSVFLNSLYVIGKAKAVIIIFSFQVIFNMISNYLFIPKYSYFACAWITVFTEILNVFIAYNIFYYYAKKYKKAS